MSKKLRIGHSPDPDDAFMFYGFASGAVKIQGFEIEHLLEDIQSLNKRALQGELDVTAISAHAYPYLANRYWILSCGASMGMGYGPLLISKDDLKPEDLAGKRVAIPGKMTTAYLLSRIYLKDYEPVEMRFDQILRAIQEEKVDAGLIIHEGQITYKSLKLKKMMDFGERWQADSDLPLPLGLDIVRSSLGESLAKEISEGLRKSIQYAFAHEEEALTYALQFGRGIEMNQARTFVRMYVNEYTLDMGDEGRRGLSELFQRAYERELIPLIPDLKII
ncbi:ABC transporter substrate-binding protein [candidate division TA06 bacterium]|nr:ABC transporter substrate-binding protein [candidate division TA06 bacterium]